MASFDWNQFEKAAEENTFQPLPEGEYNVIVAGEADLAKTKAKPTRADVSSNGNPMIRLVLKVEDGQYKGKLLFTQLTFTANSAGIVMQSLEALGIDKELRSSQKPGMERLAKLLTGQRGVVSVSIDDSYDGTPRNSVDGAIKPPKDGQQNVPAAEKTPDTALGGGSKDDGNDPF